MEELEESNTEKRGLIDINFNLFKNCDFNLNILGIGGNDGAVALSTGTVGLVAAFCTAIQLSI